MEATPNAPAILVVDDDDIVLATVQRTLVNSGYRVLTASSSPAALEVARTAAPPITVAILDYGMSVMNGTELGEALAAIHPGLRVLISSGMPSGSIQLRPGQRFLDKPFNARTLLSAVLGEILGASASQERQT